MVGHESGVILGVSADYHDAAAALVVDGTVVAAAEEERFTRRKHDPSLPRHAMAWCLESAGIEPGGVDVLAFYDKPLTTYERILVTSARSGPRGLRTLSDAVSVWSSKKLWLPMRLERVMREIGHPAPRLEFAEHHQSHAASAFYPSPFDEAAILTFDGIGEWTTASIGVGKGRHVELLRELEYPNSIGLLYSALTAFCGFEVNDGEYKLMGLAPYGEPRFAAALREHVVKLDDDGGVRLDQRWFDFQSGRGMTRGRLASLLGGPARNPDAPLTQREADIAASVQVVLEEIVLSVARHARDLTGMANVCLAGGVALNCVANGRLRREGPFDEVWIQPAAGDSGGAIGAALWSWHEIGRHPRVAPVPDGMGGALLGPSYPHGEIATWLDREGIAFEAMTTEAALVDLVAGELASGAVVGWFAGRMEFGPRALGNRSILADPRDPAMVARINQAVKGREGFRPFAPAVPVEDADAWFDLAGPSPYMLVTEPVAADRQESVTAPAGASFSDRLGLLRSAIPAATHVDQSARVQTVDPATNPRFHALLRAFGERTGCPVLLNTSFNRRDEPIVRTPADAYRCFLATGIDLLVLEGCVIRRSATVGQVA